MLIQQPVNKTVCYDHGHKLLRQQLCLLSNHFSEKTIIIPNLFYQRKTVTKFHNYFNITLPSYQSYDL